MDSNTESDELACLVIAHRGASAVHPENTLAAFAGAATLGAHWVELDVHLTSDGVAAIHHDAHLPDGRHLGDVAVADLPPSVPTLAAALTVCRDLDLGVNIEIKSDPRAARFDPTYRIVDVTLALLTERADVPRADGTARYLVTSFDAGCLDAVRERSALPTGQLAFDISDVDQLLTRAAAAGHAAVNPWAGFVDAAFVAGAHGAGLHVYPWTVDDPERMRELVALGVDGIITNVPDVLRGVLRSVAG